MTEDDLMPIICEGWRRRADAIDLPKKGKKRSDDMCAYMQGALQALVAARIIEPRRFEQIWLLAAIGRLEDFVNRNADNCPPEEK